MSRLRLLLFWLLVLVVPLQGFAATTKLVCDSARGAHGPRAVDAGGEGHDHSHHVNAHHVHVHPESAAHLDGDVDTGPTATSPDDAAHQCGLCAACCHAVALGPEYQPVLASPAPQAGMPEFAASMPSRSVRLPEKPPRG